MKSIDHYVAVVHNQEAARSLYERLGFHVRPTATHIEFGSTNAVIIFQNTYLELLVIDNARGGLREQYIDRFDAGPGMAHVSLTADSLAEEWERLKGFGYTPGPEGNARRKVFLPDGSDGETDSSFLYNWKSPHRFLSLFFSEHRKPDMIFIKGYTDHPNGAIDTARIVGLSAAPDADLDYFQTSYGHSAEEEDATGFVMRGGRGDVVEVRTKAALASRYGALIEGFEPGPLGGFPVALHYAVKDLGTTRQVLEGKGISLSDVDRGIAVAPADAEGIIIVFEGT